MLKFACLIIFRDRIILFYEECLRKIDILEFLNFQWRTFLNIQLKSEIVCININLVVFRLKRENVEK